MSHLPIARLSSSLVLLLASVAAQAPPVGVARWLPGDVQPGPVYGNEQAPVLSAGGPGYLLVWTDTRSTPLGSAQNLQSDVDLYGRLLDPSGAPLGADFPIVTGYGYQKQPAVAWNGANWLVAYVDQTPTGSFYQDAVKAVRVSALGVVLDAPFMLIDASSEVHVAANGGTWLVVGQSYDSVTNAGLVGRRVAANGTLPDVAPVVLVAPTFFLYFQADVAVAHGEYLLTWSETNAQQAHRFSAALAPLGAKLTLPGSKIAGNGSDWFVAWNDNTLRGTPLKADGTLLIPAGAVVATGSDAWQTELDAGWDGSNWIVGWVHTFNGVKLARVTTAGAVLDPGGKILDATDNGFIYGLDLAGGAPGAGTQVAWSDIRGGGTWLYDVRGRHVSAGLSPGAESVLSTDAPAQMRVELAAYPGGFLATWESRLSTGTRILAQRLDASGVALDAEPIEIATGSVAAPTAVWNGSLFMVAWSDADGIRTRRLASDGSPIGASSVLVMPAGFSPDVAPLGNLFLVVGLKVSVNPEVVAVYSVRVSAASGLPLDATPPNIGDSYSVAPRVIAAGNRWLATWEQHPSHDNPQSSVMTCFVQADGSASAPLGVALNGGSPDVAFSGIEALFVYRVNSLANANNDVWFRRMLPNGALDAAGLLSAGPGRQLEPVVAFDGTRFVAAWEDQRNQVTFYDGRTDVYAARISSAGVLLDPAGFAIENAATPEARPAIAGTVGTPGATLAVSSVLRSTAGLATWRLEARTIGTEPLWSDLGHALAGATGAPFLSGAGALTAGSVLQLGMEDAAPAAPATLVVGFTELLVPFKGGVFVPADDLLVLGLLTDSLGALSLTTSWPAGVPSGLELFLQVWTEDAGAPKGLSASNGLRALVP